MNIKSYSFPFPVADTETGPSIHWDSYELTLTFTSYQKEHCTVVFSETLHFEFLCEGELDSQVYPYDGVVEVIDSPIINRLMHVGEIFEDEADEYTHLVIGFNEIGSRLVVIFKSMKNLA